MDWGTKQVVSNEGESRAYVAQMQGRFPLVKSSYVPSGKMPVLALLWLGLGAAVGIPAGVLTGMLLGGITLLLVALIGLLLGLMAACGRVLCIVALAEIVVVLGGVAITFAGVGGVPGLVVASMGKFGKNRNAWAAALASLPSALVAYVIVVLMPQVAAVLAGPADPYDDYALSTLVHMVADLTWLTGILYGLGFLIAIGSAVFFAFDTVGTQKFCEPCERYMDENALPPMSYDVAAWAIDAVRRDGAATIAPNIPREGGSDVSPKIFACPGCGNGYFEAEAHVRVEWPAPKGGMDSRTETWLCASTPTAPEHTRALVQAKKVEPT